MLDNKMQERSELKPAILCLLGGCVNDTVELLHENQSENLYAEQCGGSL